MFERLPCAPGGEKEGKKKEEYGGLFFVNAFVGGEKQKEGEKKNLGGKEKRQELSLADVPDPASRKKEGRKEEGEKKEKNEKGNLSVANRLATNPPITRKKEGEKEGRRRGSRKKGEGESSCDEVRRVCPRRTKRRKRSAKGKKGKEEETAWSKACRAAAAVNVGQGGEAKGRKGVWKKETPEKTSLFLLAERLYPKRKEGKKCATEKRNKPLISITSRLSLAAEQIGRKEEGKRKKKKGASRGKKKAGR